MKNKQQIKMLVLKSSPKESQELASIANMFSVKNKAAFEFCLWHIYKIETVRNFQVFTEHENSVHQVAISMTPQCFAYVNQYCLNRKITYKAMSLSAITKTHDDLIHDRISRADLKIYFPHI